MNEAQITLGRAQRVDAACDQFEADFKARRSPRIDDFVARAAEADRDTLRSALGAIERELRERSTADTSVTSDSVVSAAGRASERTTIHPSNSEAIPQSIARFEILGILGVGAFGRVYKARDPQLGREVAIKVPLPSTIASAADKERFLREARTGATINHPNVCQIFEVGEYESRPYIVMGIVPGKSLAELLKDLTKPLRTRQIAQVAHKIALALSAAHEHGIVHRDLKPGNVMFDSQRKDIVVMDFGLARGPQLGDARVTQSGVVMGSPAYMSPEQARGESKDVGPSCDIYALGVMLYEMLTSTRPFVGTATEVIGQILHVEPEAPSQRTADVDPALEAICLKAMAKDPAQRFSSMKELGKVLGALTRPAVVPAPAEVDIASAADTNDEADRSTLEGPNVSEVFAAIFADRHAQQAATAAAVDAAVNRARTPTWVWTAVVATMLGGFLLLGGIIFFSLSRGVRVSIELTDVDLSDKTLSYLLDNDPITAEELSKEIELSVGEHNLIVKRGPAIVNHMRLTVKGKQDRVIKVQHVIPPQAREPLANLTPDGAEHFGPMVFENSLSTPDTFDKLYCFSSFPQEVVPDQGLKLLGYHCVPLVWATPYIGDRYRVEFELQLLQGGFAGCVLNGPGVGLSTDSGDWWRVDTESLIHQRQGDKLESLKLPKPIALEEWIAVQAEASDGKTAVRINGQLVAQHLDRNPLTGPLHGWVGIAGKNVLVRNLRIWSRAADLNRERQLIPPVTEKPRGNGPLVYELKMTGDGLGPEWWMSRPGGAAVGKGALLMSNTGNLDTSVILTNPLSGDFAFEVEFEYLKDFYTIGFSALAYFAPQAPQSSRQCESFWQLRLPGLDGLGAIVWYRAPKAEGDVSFGTRGPKVASIPFYSPVVGRKYRVRFENTSDSIRTFLDGGLLLTAKKPRADDGETLPAFVGLQQHSGGKDVVKIHSLRVYSLVAENQKSSP